ncbi:MAG: carbon monoxide dehydrogenase [Marmoricola sp.]|jgi:carbon monoxide dehydrogenase subunit G|nr:carbon monoxide dehydrogenase [Marmoricola sp.]
MDLNHRFTVPTSVDETWARFQDIASVAECFPGAQVTSVDGDTFQGTCKVKLGPIALTYAGSGTFVERDEAAHSFVVEAKGRDKRGNGTAGATVTLTMVQAAAGTDVEVDTDLSITGKPAQFGRGVMQDVSDKLLGQFVSCLEQRLGESAMPEAEPEAEPVPEAAPAPTVVAPSDPAAEPPRVTAPPRPASPPAPAARRPSPPADDALDLGATVLPVLLKSYWKQGAVALLVIVALVRWLRR